MKPIESAAEEPVPVAWHLEPVPVDGCGVCAALAAQREEARSARTRWTVRECNDELRNHLHGRVVGESPG